MTPTKTVCNAIAAILHEINRKPVSPFMPLFTPHDELTADLGLDELDIIEIVMTVEEKLGISLDEQNIGLTVGDLCALVEASVREKVV